MPLVEYCTNFRGCINAFFRVSWATILSPKKKWDLKKEKAKNFALFFNKITFRKCREFNDLCVFT